MSKFLQFSADKSVSLNKVSSTGNLDSKNVDLNDLNLAKQVFTEKIYVMNQRGDFIGDVKTSKKFYDLTNNGIYKEQIENYSEKLERGSADWIQLNPTAGQAKSLPWWQDNFIFDWINSFFFEPINYILSQPNFLEAVIFTPLLWFTTLLFSVSIIVLGLYLLLEALQHFVNPIALLFPAFFAGVPPVPFIPPPPPLALIVGPVPVPALMPWLAFLPINQIIYYFLLITRRIWAWMHLHNTAMALTFLPVSLFIFFFGGHLSFICCDNFIQAISSFFSNYPYTVEQNLLDLYPKPDFSYFTQSTENIFVKLDNGKYIKYIDDIRIYYDFSNKPYLVIRIIETHYLVKGTYFINITDPFAGGCLELTPDFINWLIKYIWIYFVN